MGDKALLYDADRGGLIVGENDPFAPLGVIPRGARIIDHNGIGLVGLDGVGIGDHFGGYPIQEGDVIRYVGDDGVTRTMLLGGGKLGVVQDVKFFEVTPLNVTADNFNAEMRVYLRMAGDYRLADAAGTGLTEWANCPSDATPVMTSASIPRNPEDDYELYR